MAYRRSPRNLLAPVPGFYAVRLVPHGWRVPVEITHGDDGEYGLIVNGVPWPGRWHVNDLRQAAVSATAEGTLFEHPLFRVVLFGAAIDETTYRHRLAVREWASEHCPGHPCLDPTKPMDAALLPAEDF